MAHALTFAGRLLTAGGALLTDGASSSGGSSASSIASVNEPANLAVAQRAAGGTTRALTFTASYTGADPTMFQWRVEDFTSAATVVDWSDFASFTASGGSATGTALAIPQGDNYRLRVRDKLTPGVAWSGAHMWGVGVCIVMSGQSNMVATMSSQGLVGGGVGTEQYTAAHTTKHGRIYADLGWAYNGFGSYPGGSAVGGDLLVADPGYAFIRELVAGLGGNVPVAILPLAISGVGIGTWSPGGTNYTKYTAATGGGTSGTDVSGLLSTIYPGDVEAVCWHQGENDSGAGTPATTLSTYLTELDTWYNGWLALVSPFGRTHATLHICMPIIGNVDPTVAPNIEMVRQAQIEWTAAKQALGWAVTTGEMTTDLVRATGDTLHMDNSGSTSTPTSAVRALRRVTQDLLHWLVPATYPHGSAGPKINAVGVSRAGAVITLPIVQDGGTALQTAAGGNPTGFYVSTDNFATGCGPGTGAYLTPASVTLSGTNVLIDLGTWPGGTVYVKYLGGTPNTTGQNYDGTHNASTFPDITNCIYDNGALPPYPLLYTTSDPLGLPLQPTDGSIAVT